jgi:radical SAM protein with 4Fe4S-binding SPASM domain
VAQLIISESKSIKHELKPVRDFLTGKDMHKLSHIFKLGMAYKIMKSARLSYPPYQYTVEPTNICNLNCEFCPQSNPEHRNSRERGHLSPENFSTFLDRIKQAGGSNRYINLTLDGEPLLNHNFPDLIRAANEKGYFPVFASNGVLLAKDPADRIIDAGPFRASIDFASDENIFESIRGKKGHFTLVKKNLDYLIKRACNNKNIQIDIYDIAPFRGIDADYSLQKMRAMFPSELPNTIGFRTRQFHNFCGHLNVSQDRDSYRICPYPWTQMAVTWNGNCVACCRDTAGKSILCNVFDESIESVWNGEKYRQFRRNLLDGRPDLNAACKDCDLPYTPDKKRWSPKYILRSLFGR